MRRLAPLLIALAAIGIAAAPHRAESAPAADSLLRGTAQIVYDVDPSERTRVTWDVTLKNNDPETVFREQGVVSFYDSYNLPLLRGAGNVSAVGPGGGPLAVTVRDQTPGPVV
ncbi:MAG: hypothetical protein HYS09_09860, partial [Chloroflexi bacterium]|nr:hypothetical protein [Chloroflexota bacterium]